MKLSSLAFYVGISIAAIGFLFAFIYEEIIGVWIFVSGWVIAIVPGIIVDICTEIKNVFEGRKVSSWGFFVFGFLLLAIAVLAAFLYRDFRVASIIAWPGILMCFISLLILVKDNWK